MDRNDDINRVSQILLDAEVKLRQISNQVAAIEREIATLTVIEANLKENIRWLKKRKIVTVASEYRKVREQLKTAETRKSILNIDKENTLKIQRHTEQVYQKVKEQHDLALARLQDPKNVIYVSEKRWTRMKS